MYGSQLRVSSLVHIVINITFGMIAKEKTLRQRTNDRRLATIGHRTTFNYEFFIPKSFFPWPKRLHRGENVQFRIWTKQTNGQ